MKRKILASLIIFVFLTIAPIMSIHAYAAVEENIIVSVPWEKINSCGHQAVSGPCQAYCWAYCRIILDNTAHTYRDYWTGKLAVSPSAAGYVSQTTKMTSKQRLLETICDNVDLGRPVVVSVQGKNGAKFHYVVAIGYRKECDRNSLKESDILILNPANGAINPAARTQETFTYLNSCTLTLTKTGDCYVCWTAISGGTKTEESTLKITPTAYPTGTQKEGFHYSLWGSVTSNFNITTVKGEIINSNGNVMSSYTQRPNARSFSILNSKLDANMKFNELSPGKYYLKYTAEDERGKSVEWYSDTFEVQGEQRERFVTVTFDPEGGSVNQRTKTVAAGELIGTLPVPVREGYDFAGWATGRGSSMIVESDNYWVEEDATLYARWRPKPMEEPPAQEDPGVEITEPEPEPEPVGHWGEWSEWGYIPVSASETRQVETDQIKVSDAYTEYRYGRYIDPTGKHNCWCATYLEGLFKGAAREQYSSWSRTRYSASGTGWSCGNCKGNHRGVDHTGSDGRDWWAEYVLPNGHYYWEESKTVPAEYETQYRYRDWIYG